ncbi:MAG: response regulator transcription factor [bacterium]
MKTLILLADDHGVVRNGLRGVLEKQPDFEVVGETGDGREAIEMAQRTKVDVIVMDINMPNVSGLEATQQIKAICPDVKIVTLSVHSQGPIIAQMIRAGASGYLPKTCAAQELIEAIRTVMRGRTYISPQVMHWVTEHLHSEPDDATSQHPDLTPRESEVLMQMANGKTTKEISACLNLSERTVEFHRHNIMDKLGIHSVAELTKYAIRQGLTTLNNE